jgi:hypothetical protein
MVSWWERVLLSLASVVMAALVCLAGVLLHSALPSHRGSLQASDLIFTGGFVVFFCSLGWVLSVPFVLVATNLRGWRFWLYLALGSGAGPLLMFAVFAFFYLAVPQSPSAHWFGPELRPLVYLAAAISSLTALIYLLLLRRAQARALSRGRESPIKSVF